MKAHLQWVFDSTWPAMVISSVVIITLRIWYIIKNKKPFLLYHELIMLSFMLYIMCLFYVVTSPDDLSTIYNSYNLIPFKEMFRYTLMSRLFIKNVLGNLFMFIPLGFFSSYILKIHKSYQSLLFVSIVSLTIELTQLSIGRVFDIDDIILNVIGGLLGYFLYQINHQIKAKFPRFFGNPFVYNAITFLAIALFIFVAFKIIII